jgi:hypothetical protein
MSETAVRSFPITDEMVREGCGISHDFVSAFSRARREELVRLILDGALSAARPAEETSENLVECADEAVRACLSAWACGRHANRIEMVEAIERLQAAVARCRVTKPADAGVVQPDDAFETSAIVERLRKRAAFFRFHQTADLLREAADTIESQTVALARKRQSIGGARTMEALTNAKGLLQAFIDPENAIAQTAISDIDSVLNNLQNGRTRTMTTKIPEAAVEPTADGAGNLRMSRREVE